MENSYSKRLVRRMDNNSIDANELHSTESVEQQHDPGTMTWLYSCISRNVVRSAITFMIAIIIVVTVLTIVLSNGTHKTQNPYSLTVLMKPVSSPVVLSSGVIGATEKAYDNLPSLNKLESLLKSMGVSITVDQTEVSLGLLALRTKGFDYNVIGTVAVNASRDGLSISKAVSKVTPLSGLSYAAAVLTLDKLLQQKAKADGTEVSMSAAKAFAEEQYNIAQRLNLPHEPITLKQAILSPYAISSYRNMLTDEKMIGVITGYSYGSDRLLASSISTRANFSGANNVFLTSINHTPILQKWMKGQLKSHVVKVSGIAGVNGNNISSYLPPDL